jgi:hypothetical protein
MHRHLRMQRIGDQAAPVSSQDVSIPSTRIAALYRALA